MNKKITILIGLCLLSSLAGLILIFADESTEWGYLIVDIGLVFGQLLGLMMMVHSGTIIGTSYFRVIVAFLAIILLGALLKILHYEFADQTFLLGSLGISATYLVRFFAKKEKRHLDWLKLLWVLSAYLGGELIVAHIIHQDFIYLVQGIFWILLIDFVWLEFKTKGAN